MLQGSALMVLRCLSLLLYIYSLPSRAVALRHRSSYHETTAIIPVYRSEHGGDPTSYLQTHHAAVLLDEAPPIQVFRGSTATGGSISSQIVAAHSAAAPSVAPMFQYPYHQYVAQFSVGTPAQSRFGLIDTGSANVWIVDDRCTSESCNKVPQFHRDMSSSFRPTSPAKSLDIMFGTGRVVGHVGVDSLEIGGIQIPSQHIGLVEREIDAANNNNRSLFDKIRFEGILGLAFPAMLNTGGRALGDSLVDQGIQKFTFFLSRDESKSQTETLVPQAAVVFGDVDEDRFEAPMKYVPVSQEYYWETALKEFWVGSTKFCCEADQPSYVIFDTGTTYNTLPSSEMPRFLGLIPKPGSALEDYPILRYVLSNNVEIELTPEMYVLRSSNADEGLEGESLPLGPPAYMAIDVPSEYGHAYLLGSYPYMRHYVTQFDRGPRKGQARIGIAKPSGEFSLSDFGRAAETIYDPATTP